MKFLCVACDEAMVLQETLGPEEGSMTVIFGCPACGRETAMLTNAMETQVVRSLGVKIGGRSARAEPMEMVQTSLAQTREDQAGDGSSSASPEPAQETRSGSKCPFTGVVDEAYEQREQKKSALRWTSEARARLERIPAFARPMARKGIEQHAREQGCEEISEAVMDEVKGQFGL